MDKNNEYRQFTRDLGFKLRLMRDFLELDMLAASERFDLAPGMIASYESGKDNPNLLYLIRIADACGVQLEIFKMDKNQFVKTMYF